MAIRLGYACINTTLQTQRDKVYTGRTVRKQTWYPKRDLTLLGTLALNNARDLLKILSWNEANDIKLFRIGSELFPWHDHYELHELPQYDLIKSVLEACGNFARRHGHRLTTHPGPFHILGARDINIVKQSIIGLERHSELFDLMGYSPSHENKINIHIGGTYGDPTATAVRWLEGYSQLSPNCRARIVVENDDKPSQYSVQMLYNHIHLPAKSNGMIIPITFDYFHHSLHPDGLSEEAAFMLARSTWPENVTQCCHYSESRRGEYTSMLEKMLHTNGIDEIEINNWPHINKLAKQLSQIKNTAHADYIYTQICTYGVTDVDIVIEAKAKEKAILEHRKCYIYN